jgi:uncharacterized protein
VISAAGGEQLDNLMREVYDNGSLWASIYSSSYSSVSEAIYRCIYFLVVDPMVFRCLAIMLSIFVLIRLLHRRPFRSVMTTGDRLNRCHLIQGFGLSFLLISGAYMVDYFLSYPNPLSRVHVPLLFGIDFITILVGLTITATAEEVLFRGYMLQALGLLTRNRIVLAVVIGFLFTMLHLTKPGLTYYILLGHFEVGVFLTIMTLKSNGIELAVGSHVAYNLAGVVIWWSVGYTPTHLSILFPICAAVTYLVVFRRNASPEPETEQPQRL